MIFFGSDLGGEMKRVLFSIAAVCALTLVPAKAELLPCVQGPLSSYIGLTCGLGGGFFGKNFYFEAVDLNPADPTILATASDILVTPLFATPEDRSIGFGFSSTKFDIKGFQHVAYAFTYLIDPPPPIIPGFDFFMDSFSPVAPGLARITTDICVGGEFVNGFDINLILKNQPLDENGCESGIEFPNTFRLEVFDNGAPGDKKLFDAARFTELTNVVDVRIVLEMNAKGASSQIDGFRSVATLVPEPGSLALGAAGLLLLGYLRTRNRR
jgi:hypothetical protein